MSKTEKVTQVELSFDPSILSTHSTTASKIRYLTSCNMKRGQIAKTLNIKYQWVRNVQITPIKKS